MRLETKRKLRWHKWFAWFPVRDWNTGDWLWFETVERDWNAVSVFGAHWIYRAVTVPGIAIGVVPTEVLFASLSEECHNELKRMNFGHVSACRVPQDPEASCTCMAVLTKEMD